MSVDDDTFSLPTNLQERRLMTHHLARLLYEHQMHIDDKVERCSLPDCKEMQDLMNHIRSCSAERACPYPQCESSLGMMKHFTRCTSDDCPVCLLLKPFPFTQLLDDVKQVSKSSTLPHKNKILSDLKELFLNKEYCDAVLRVKGQEFPAHKAILVARSPVFSSMFRCDMKEKKTGEVDIKDCDPSVFSNFLHFLYCTDASIISQENIFSLYTVADKYDVPDLKEACVEFLIKNLSVDMFVRTVVFAIQWAENELIIFCRLFFIEERHKILATAEWKSFIVHNPVESNEFLLNLRC